ncbi:MAG: oligosaccharide flippase family protein [Candidatus Gracilibacteria bacterium]
MVEHNKNSKRIVKNTMMLYFRMILIMLVSLYTSRIILNVLGVEDFGIYNVVGGVVTMFVFLNGAMASSTQRFLSYEIGKNDFKQLQKTFNVTLVIHVVIAIIIFLLIETVGVWVLNNYLNIPKERMEAAQWVYHFSAFSFLISIIKVPYNAIIIAHERMNIYAYVSIFEVFMKLLIVFMLTWISFDKLKLYGILLFGVNVVVAIIYGAYSRLHFLETKFELVKDKALYKILISYSGWNLFGNLALVAKGQGITIILNIFFGPVVNAAQAVANQVNAAVQAFFSNFQMAVNPQIIKSYSANDRDYMLSLILRSAKFSFYLLFILSLPIILEVDTILNLWLKIVPNYASSFTILILITVLIDSFSGPLMTGIQATGNIKVFQIIVGTLQILILPLSYFLFKFHYPPQATYFVSIAISIIALVIRLFIMKSLIDEFSIKIFIEEVIFRNIVIVVLSLMLPLLLKYLLDYSILNSLIIIIISVLSCTVFIYYLGLKNNEKVILKVGIQKLFVKIKYLIIKLFPNRKSGQKFHL